MAMNVQLVPTATSLTIGDSYTENNKIEFSIDLEGDEVVFLRLQVPIGADGVLRAPENANDITISALKIAANNETLPVTSQSPEPPPDGVNSNNTKEWWLVDLQTGMEVSGKVRLSVSIGNVLCLADAGDSQIRLNWETASRNGQPTLTIAKKKPDQLKTKILYFIAEPTFLIGGGKVTLTWDLVGDKTATLQPSGELERPATSPTQHYLNEDGHYTLRAGSDQKQVPVDVLAKGWHEIRPLGDNAFPSVIFHPGNPEDDSLYAIFLYTGNETGKKPVLCESQDGIMGWRIINDSVPRGMEASPGLRLGNRLWLIGGSAVDPDQKTARSFATIWITQVKAGRLPSSAPN